MSSCMRGGWESLEIVQVRQAENSIWYLGIEAYTYLGIYCMYAGCHLLMYTKYLYTSSNCFPSFFHLQFFQKLIRGLEGGMIRR